MKKVVVVLLVVCMLVATLAGCGVNNNTTETENPTQTNGVQGEQNAQKPESNEDSENKKEEQTNKEVAVGTILDTPEVLFDADAEELYVYFTTPTPGATANETTSMEIAVNQVTADTYVLYMTDGLLKNNEVVYEVTDAGVTKYYKDTFMDAFAQETEMNKQVMEEEKNEVLTLLSYFMMEHPDYAGIQYRKSDAKVATLTGDVYVYDVMENNESTGQICIDKNTGVMVSLKDAKGDALCTVHDFKVENVEIPAYK